LMPGGKKTEKLPTHNCSQEEGNSGTVLQRWASMMGEGSPTGGKGGHGGELSIKISVWTRSRRGWGRHETAKGGPVRFSSTMLGEGEFHTEAGENEGESACENTGNLKTGESKPKRAKDEGKKRGADPGGGKDNCMVRFNWK